MNIYVDSVTREVRPIKGGPLKGKDSIGLKAGDKWYNVLYEGQREELKGKDVTLAEVEGGQYPVYKVEGAQAGSKPSGGGQRSGSGGGRAQEWDGMVRAASEAVGMAQRWWKEDTESQRTFVNTVVMAYCRGELQAPGAATAAEAEEVFSDGTKPPF